MPRVRRSLRELEAQYEAGDRAPLEQVIRAFRGIQKLAPTDKNSFFEIAGYHGEPFRGKGATDPNVWGGYCNHDNVLFPLWHRAYLLRLEDALRSIEGCEDVALPFWDECFDMGSPIDPKIRPIPKILTDPEFVLDGEQSNPLYSYKLQQKLTEDINEQRYSKYVNYETVRYPLSGLVGTEQDQAETTEHNIYFLDQASNTETLNKNVYAWMKTGVKIPDWDDDPKTRKPGDLSPIYNRFLACLDTPWYTQFSNTTSAAKYNGGVKIPENPQVVMSLESPHNHVHLAVGGFYQKGEYNADPIYGANGDMGDNETASFDPIFYFHHAFIDYVFWTWQRKHGYTDKLTIDENDEGANSGKGSAGFPANEKLNMNSPLKPFVKSHDHDDEVYYTPNDIVNIEQLGYTYGPGSLDPFVANEVSFFSNAPPLSHVMEISNINKEAISGSFVIRLFAKGPGQKEPIEVGREAVLSRWNVASCANCQNHLEKKTHVPIFQPVKRTLLGNANDDGEIEYSVELRDRRNNLLNGTDSRAPKLRHVLNA